MARNRRPACALFPLALLVLNLAACGSGSGGGDEASRQRVEASQPQNLDRSCDLAPYPSPQWTECENKNYGKTLEAPAEALDPVFAARLLEQNLINVAKWTRRGLEDPSWLSPLSGNSAVTPLCASWDAHCVGDPFRYPEAEGPDGSTFYQQEAEVEPVVFYDLGCARLSGRVWRPKGVEGALPGVVITNGSFQAAEPSYWFLAQRLVRHGYAVLTYDPRGQGMSDMQTPTFEQGSNANAKVFWEGQVDAIDFFLSTPNSPYRHNQSCADTYPTAVNNHNPQHLSLDPQRIGIAGHSMGGVGASVVQGYGTPDADPWPGTQTSHNPVKAVVGLDSLINGDFRGFAPEENLGLPEEVEDAILTIFTQGNLPSFGVGAPALSFSADYAVAPVPYLAPPDFDGHRAVFDSWQEAGVPVYVLTFQGTTHLDYSLFPAIPATSWCADTRTGACRGSFGRGAIEHYALAWFDRWLKLPGEIGYDSADQRLLDDGGEHGALKMSFRYRSSRDFPDRSGFRHLCEDIRAGCSD